MREIETEKFWVEITLFKKSLKYPIQDYQCFSTGHPYVWVEVLFDDVCDEIDKTLYQTHIFTWRKASFSLKNDEEKKRIYIVHGNKFNWNKLKHYDEWIESKKEVANRIALYKKNS